MTSEIRRELIDRFTNSEWHVFARIQISFFRVQLKKKRRKNIQNQAEFNVRSHDERRRHSENVLIEKSELSNELSDRQMTSSKEFWHVIEKSSCCCKQAEIKKFQKWIERFLYNSNELIRASIHFVRVRSVCVRDVIQFRIEKKTIFNRDWKDRRK